ncbi:MAG: sulfotransferase [Pseudomonadota bacterium]
MRKNKKAKGRAIVPPPSYTPTEQILTKFERGESLFAAQNHEHARQLYQSIIAEDKYFLPAIRQLGICELFLGENQKAIVLLEKYGKSAPDDALNFAYLAQAYRAGDQTILARRAIAAALKIERTADLFFLAAEIEETLSAFAKAIDFYRKGLEIDPHRPTASLSLAILLKNAGQYREAQLLLEKLTDNAQTSLAAKTNLGNLCHLIGAYELAEQHFSNALREERHADILYNLGLCLQQLRKIPQSIECFTETIKLVPSHIEAKIQLAESKSSMGAFDDAREVFDITEEDSSTWPRVAYLKAQITKIASSYSDLEQQLTKALRSEKDQENVVFMNFALAKIYDETGRYDLAFEHIDRANRIKYKSVKPAAKTYLAEIDKRLAGDGDKFDSALPLPETGRQPLFIVGMPRSGTTLLEKSIASRSIAPCGEVDYFGPAIHRHANFLGEFRNDSSKENAPNEFLNSLKQGFENRIAYAITEETSIFIDKTPDNFKFYDLISALYPNALFIHCLRHPLDVCISIYFQLFEGLPYSYDLDSIAECFHKTEELISRYKTRHPGRWLAVQYEDLVTGNAAVKDRISDFLNLDPEHANHEALEKKVPFSIQTMSKWQARQDLYQTSIGRWKHYEKYLGRLQASLLPG